ncbi:SAM-dependent methyltransferase [Geodermatophilus sp. URMC 62]|uniref:SAM-dependent methyltransferase n=1 Tax=Geodermatophilus sp. URMC 62 TaxID=3423414 RepID=UPI00406CACF0
MTESSEERLSALMHAGDQAAWSTAALVLALRGDGPPALVDAARRVVDDMGLDLGAALAGRPPAGTAAQASAPLLQAAAVVRGEAAAWAEQPDEALLAQGLASGRGAPGFLRLAGAAMPGLSEAVSRRGARMLDVGTGVGGLAVALAETLPQLTVVGIDVLPRVLALAERVRAASPAGDRVVLRRQDVAALDEPDTYDLIWLPAPFLPEPTLLAALPAATRALRPGGWLMLGHGKYGHDPVENALNRFKTVAYGGTALDATRAQQLLAEVGLTAVSTAPTPLGSPGITVGRRQR